MGKLDANKLLDSLLLKIIDWANRDKLKIIKFVILSSVVLIISYLPYFNLVFTKALVIFLVVVLFIFLFRLKWKMTLYLSLSLLLISYVLTILGLISTAEIIGNYVYGLLVLVIFGFFLEI